jgi:hypothetical protein
MAPHVPLQLRMLSQSEYPQKGQEGTLPRLLEENPDLKDAIIYYARATFMNCWRPFCFITSMKKGYLHL